MIRRLIILLLIVGCEEYAPIEHTHDGVCVEYWSAVVVDEEIVGDEEWRCFKHLYDEWNCLSLVADVGLNWIFWDFSTENQYEGYNYTEKTQTELNIHLGMSYSKLSLHFKF